MGKTAKAKTPLYPHQRKAVARAIDQGSHAFLFEPRCGKTRAVLVAIAKQHARGKVRKVVVIAPLSVLSVWEDEIRKFLTVSAVVMVTGESAWIWRPKGETAKPTLRIYLINYDKFSRRGDDEAYRNSYLETVERWDPDLFVLDESHRVKSAGAVRSQALWRAVRRARDKRGGRRPYVYLLTGTPNPKGYIDIFSQYRILDERIFGTSKAGFEEIYCRRGYGKRKYVVVQYLNKKRLLKRIRERATIVTAEKAGLAGVETFNHIKVKLPPKIRQAYIELAEELVTMVEDQIIDAANAGVKRLRLLQLCGGFTTDGTRLHTAKLDAARDYLLDIKEQRESVVVYANYLPEVAAMADLCTKLGFVTATVHGGVRGPDRAAYRRRFQAQGRTSAHALVYQAQSGSLGIDLSAAAETFFYSTPDGWETFYQCTRRVLGPDQNRPVRHTILSASGTVDVSRLEALRGKKDMHREMMRNPRSFLMGL